MHGVKGAYLKKLTAAQPMPSARIGTTLEGTSPPSVFIGSWNYPKVYAGPMISPSFGDIQDHGYTGMLDIRRASPRTILSVTG